MTDRSLTLGLWDSVIAKIDIDLVSFRGMTQFFSVLIVQFNTAVHIAQRESLLCETLTVRLLNKSTSTQPNIIVRSSTVLAILQTSGS